MAPAPECVRSLGSTLKDAVVTFLVFLVTALRPVRLQRRSVSFSFSLRYIRNLAIVATEYWVNLQLVALAPFTPFVEALVEAMYIWQLRRIFPELSKDYVTAMALCPVFIKLKPRQSRDQLAPGAPANTEISSSSSPPPAGKPSGDQYLPHGMPIYDAGEWEEGHTIDAARVVTSSFVKSLDPVTVDYSATVDDEYTRRLAHAGPNVVISNVAAGGKDLYIELHSGVISYTSLLSQALAAYKSSKGDPSLDNKLETARRMIKVFLRLLSCLLLALRVEEREALLAALAEDQLRNNQRQVIEERLEFARDKDRAFIPNTVRALQAAAYIWGTLQRVVQHKAASPVEEIITYLSVLVFVQMVIEVYAGARYSRVLELRLSQEQYTNFFKALREKKKKRPSGIDAPAAVGDSADHGSITAFRIQKAETSMTVILGVLIGLPFLWYAFTFYRSQVKCLLCSSSVLLFVLAPIFSILQKFVFYDLEFWYQFLQEFLQSGTLPTVQRKRLLRFLALCFFAGCVSTVAAFGMILALKATVTNWQFFKASSTSTIELA